MTNDAALEILMERRATMYDPTIVDMFVRVYQRIMPATDSTQHPIARTLGEARAPRPEERDVLALASLEAAATSEVLAVASLARAVSGQATIADVGALTWMMLRQVVPCASMGIFLYDERHDAVTMQFADGAHAASLRGVRLTLGAGIAGWAAANRRFVLNADPSIDLGPGVISMSPPLRSSLTVPLHLDNTFLAVISLYASTPDAFSDDHARLLTLLAPSLATSLASVPKSETWAAQPSEPRRAAAGEFRLLKRS
jgi:putative methionine-R-sulfoxide reductase with GAF domain